MRKDEKEQRKQQQENRDADEWLRTENVAFELCPNPMLNKGPTSRIQPVPMGDAPSFLYWFGTDMGSVTLHWTNHINTRCYLQFTVQCIYYINVLLLFLKIWDALFNKIQ